MAQHSFDRRGFLRQASLGAGALSLAAPALAGRKTSAAEKGPLALLGGKPVRTAPWPSWPRIDKNDVTAWNRVLNEGRWCRLDGRYAADFEKAYARLTGTKF